MPEHAAAHSHTIDGLVRTGAHRHPDKPMVIDAETRIDYHDLDTSTRELASAFLDAGVGKGSRVGVLMPNGTEWVRIAVALTRVGAVLVPLSTLLQPPELVLHLRRASVQFLISVEEFRGHRYLDDLATQLKTPELRETPELRGQVLHHEQLPALRRIYTADALPATNTEALQIVDELAATVTEADPMVIMFTSGSRGLPKGVVHSHSSAIGAVRSGLTSRCIDAETRLYLPMPFFWVGGFGGGILSALAAGATLVTEQIPQPETTLRLLERERVTLFRGWPDQAEALARYQDTIGANLSALQQGSLDALLPPEQRAQPGARANLFGMTESFGPYCGYAADTDMPTSAHGSCGRPFPNMQVRIADIDSGHELGPETSGMIQIRGPHILRGLCRTSTHELLTVDGFYATGDLGYLDKDGFLFYRGRSDDMFKVSGATVYPSEVEQALRTIDGVTGAFVTHIGEGPTLRVAAAVVCDTATRTAEQLRDTTRTLLSSFKVPAVWLLLDSDDDIPRGSTGKVDIYRLRDLLSSVGTASGARTDSAAGASRQ